MEKRRAHYPLNQIQAMVADPESKPFTLTALKGGAEMGLTEADMRSVVLALGRRQFYKSMTTLADTTVWQDVYHGKTPAGVTVYIKVTGYSDGRPPVIQFKRQ